MSRLQIGRASLAQSDKDFGFYPKGYGEPVKGLSREWRIRVVARSDFYFREMTLTWP